MFQNIIIIYFLLTFKALAQEENAVGAEQSWKFHIINAGVIIIAQLKFSVALFINYHL